MNQSILWILEPIYFTPRNIASAHIVGITEVGHLLVTSEGERALQKL